jgi:hypothetical protein
VQHQLRTRENLIDQLAGRGHQGRRAPAGPPQGRRPGAIAGPPRSGAALIHYGLIQQRTPRHAIQTPDPARSGLILSDGILTVAEIAAMRFPAAAFAYLSACDTARTDRTLPNVVTLAAAFHIAGYQNVIAVLDVVSDLAASQVSIDVYQRLTDGRGYLRPEGSAQALHSALLSVLSQSDELFVDCSAFIHIGP